MATAVKKSTKKFLVEMLESRGLSESQALEIVELAIPFIEAADPSYRITWTRPFDEYPHLMYVAWYKIIRPIAYKWLCENKPEAWFKDVFKEGTDYKFLRYSIK